MQRQVRGLGALVVVPLVLSGSVAGQSKLTPIDLAPEINAKCWFNAQPVRIHDAPKLLLLEFWSTRSRDSRDFVNVMTELHKAYDDGRLLVVALTEEQCDDTRHFLQREKIEYKVGAESHSAKDYGIDELPGVVLIDNKSLRVVGRWFGRDLKPRAVVKAVQESLGAPPGSGVHPGTLPEEEAQVYRTEVADTDDQLARLTSDVLGIEGAITPQALSSLDCLYTNNLPEDAALDSPTSRARDYARSALLGLDQDRGYGKLVASGRLSDAAKLTIRDRLLEIAGTDRSPSVRLNSAHALRKFAGQRGDTTLVEGLRKLHEKESDAMVRASLDHAVEELSQRPGSAETAQSTSPLTAVKLQRMLNQAADPASSTWGDAYAYQQTIPQRTTERLLEDYRAFPDPAGDENARQNAVLKRRALLEEIERRIGRAEVADMRSLKDELAKVLSEEPDPWIRHDIVWEGLKPMAEDGGRGLHGDVVELLEKRLSVESDRYVRAVLEYALQELKNK